MKVITLYPEHAEGFRLGIRKIETRGWATRYRGPLAIHAGLRDPDSRTAARSPQSRAILAAIPHGESITRGAIVATCTLVDVVPMVDASGCKNATKHLCIANESMLLHSRLDEPWPDGQTEHVVSDQLPYGDFRPGRFAWLLDDIAPTTERCPACWGGAVSPHRHRPGHLPETISPRGCWVCRGTGTCDPIPAKGKQGLWEWVG